MNNLLGKLLTTSGIVMLVIAMKWSALPVQVQTPTADVTAASINCASLKPIANQDTGYSSNYWDWQKPLPECNPHHGITWDENLFLLVSNSNSEMPSLDGARNFYVYWILTKRC